MQVLTISGKAGHGKDFVAGVATEVAELLGAKVRRFAFAWPLKMRAYAVGACAGTLDWRDVVKKDPAVRKLLQEEGTENGRNKYGADFWIYHAEAYLNLLSAAEPDVDLVIISDARFENEVQFARARGAALFVQSDRPTLTGAAALHPSEITLDPYVGTAFFTKHIRNPIGMTVGGLMQQLTPVISALVPAPIDE